MMRVCAPTYLKVAIKESITFPLSLLQNDTIEVNMRNVKDYNEVNMRAKWEVSTHEKIEVARKGKRVSQLQGQAEARLLARKRQLAGMLNAEMDGWQKEFSELGDRKSVV